MNHLFTLKQLEKKFKNRTAEPDGVKNRYAVLALMTEIDGVMHFVFEKRASELIRQPGEICFPGGRIEKGETHLETAVRETVEELGISPEKIKIIGDADYIATFYDTVIFPFVGFVESSTLENLTLSTHEVEKVFTVPVDFFEKPLQENQIYMEMYFPDDFPFDLIPNGENYKWGTPHNSDEVFYKYGNDIIWGLTARIVRGILRVMK